MSEKKLAYDFCNTQEGIRSQKIFDMRDRIRRLEASNAELLEALKNARQFISNGIQLGYIDEPAPGSPEAQTLGIIVDAIKKAEVRECEKS